MDYQVDGRHFALPSGIKIWIHTGFEPTNSYYGAARVHSATYKEAVTKSGDKLHVIPGGIFIQRKGSISAEKVRFFELVSSIHEHDYRGRYVPANLQTVEDDNTVEYNTSN